MVEEFKTLRDDEIEVLLDAPVLVSILIAGADDKIDKDEKNILSFNYERTGYYNPR